MTTVLQFGVFGLGIGAVYTLLAQGVVVIYRGSGVLNFAQAAIAMFAGFTYYDLTANSGWGWIPAVALVIVLGALFGALMHQLVMRPLRHASPLARAIATLGILIILEAVATLRWGDNTVLVPSFLPTTPFKIGDTTFTQSRVWLLGIAIVGTGILWATFRYALVGIATSASAENRRATAALGWSPNSLATLNWSVGSALAALAGVLVAPLTGLQVQDVPLLIIPAMAAALIGGFSSLPLTLVSALLIGIAQQEAGNYITTQGIADSLPFFVVVIALIVRGRGLPTRGEVAERLAELGSGRPRPLAIVVATIVAAVLILTVFSGALVSAVTASLALAVGMLSVVVLTGYAGQLSLGQLTFGGAAALISARLMADSGFPLELAWLVGVLATIPLSLAFALPALRTRGITLAIVTLGLAAAANDIFFTSVTFTGITGGITINNWSLFGLNINPSAHPATFAVVALVAFVLVALAVGNVRRSRTGRRLIAVRTNERAAAALGINVYGAKLYAFALSAAIAGVCGLLVGYSFDTVLFTQFGPFNSILLVAYAVIGGLGFLLGPLWGSLLVAGGVGTWISNQIIPSLTQYFTLIGGVFVLLLLIQEPDGMAKANEVLAKRLAKLIPQRPAKPVAAEPVDVPAANVTRVTPATLAVDGLHVRFGGVRALQGVSLSVGPGEVVGLIGPNGAGKTTLIDAVTGFVRPAEGTISLNNESIGAWPAHKRTRAGVSRSFQSLELFEDVTVRENLQSASDSRDLAAYVTNLIAPGARPLSDVAAAAVQEFELGPDLDRRPRDLPYGRRRLVAIARAIAAEPSVILLDEPAAGLDERESQELARLVRRLADNWKLGVLLVEHDMDFVMQICDRLTVLDFGRQISSGPTAEVRRDPAVIAAYLGEPEDEVTEADIPPPSRPPMTAGTPEQR